MTFDSTPTTDDEHLGAARMGDIEKIRALMASTTTLTSERNKMLHAAAACGQVETVKYLISKGVDVNAVTSGDLTALLGAAGCGNEEIMKLLVEAGANVDEPARNIRHGLTALQKAAQFGHAQAVEYLIEVGANVNALPAPLSGRTALQAAAERGHKELVKYLIDMGADVDASPAEESGRTALQAAAESGHEDIVKYLVNNGAVINKALPEKPSYDKPGRTALQAAAEKGHGEIVKYLIDKGADPNALPATYAGRTALQAVAENGHENIVKYLIEKGADVYAPPAEIYGATALMAAADRGHTEVVVLIIDNLSLEHYTNCLFSAFRNKEYKVVEIILSTGKINVNTQNDSGDTLLHLALRNHWPDIVSSLLQGQASTEIRNTEGKSPLRITLEMKDVDMMRVLLGHGACMTGVAASTVRILLGLREDKLVLLEEDEVTGCKTLSADYFSVITGAGPGRRALYSAFGVPFPSVKHLVRHLPIGHTLRTAGSAYWSWSLAGFNPVLDMKLGIPDLKAISPNSRIGCFVWFSLLVTRPQAANEMGIQPFLVDRHECELLWIMRPGVKSDSESGGKQIMRSVEFYSALNFLWVPNHGVEFFEIFVSHILAKWEELFMQAKLHLARSRKILLQDKGENPDLVDVLLKDSQTWTDFDEHLGRQVYKCRELLKDIEQNKIIYEEVKKPQEEEEDCKGHEISAIKDLSRNINELEQICQKEIQLLERKTKEMIELEFNLVSIYEARRSITMAVSMKRLSWITFVFLPLMFASSLFGMNIDILSSNPSWTWYLVINVPILVLVLLAWILFKYIPIERWVEGKVRAWFENSPVTACPEPEEVEEVPWKQPTEIVYELALGAGSRQTSINYG